MVHILMLFPSTTLSRKSTRPITYGKTAGFFVHGFIPDCI